MSTPLRLAVPPANTEGWGPTTLPEKFVGVPFQPFSKNEPLGVVAAIFQTHKDRMYSQRQQQHQQHQQQRDGAGALGGGGGGATASTKEEAFELVDNAPAQSKDPSSFFSGRSERRWFRGGRGGRFGTMHGGHLVGMQRDEAVDPNLKAKLTKNLPPGHHRGGGGGRGGRGGGHGGGRGGGYGGGGGGAGGGMWGNRRYIKEDSVKVGALWKPLDQFDVSAFFKMSTAAPSEVTTLYECGSARRLDDSMERVSVKTPKPLKLNVDTAFVYPGTLDDPVLEGFAREEVGNVYCTDEILAQLAALPKTTKPFDLVFTKVDGVLFIDKRDDSLIHMLTVNETFTENLAEKDEARLRAPYNTPSALEVEATAIHQNAFYACTLDEGAQVLEKPNPFVTFSPKAQPFKYRYRSYKLGPGGKYTVVCRTEVHAIQPPKGAMAASRQAPKDVVIFTPNEFDARLSGNLSWREKLETQNGAVLSAETRNNAAKYAKWTALALLSGADLMKLAFVSRVSVVDPTKHAVLGVATHKPKEFAQQFNFNVNNMWGILLAVVDLFMNKPDGKYVFMRDPNKAIIRIYEVPLTEFEHESSSDEEDEEEDGGGGDDDDVGREGREGDLEDGEQDDFAAPGSAAAAAAVVRQA